MIIDLLHSVLVDSYRTMKIAHQNLSLHKTKKVPQNLPTKQIIFLKNKKCESHIMMI